ncbi:MAG: cytochrome c6 PetJ [Rivularia sp. (in: cyanobacteria)]
MKKIISILVLGVAIFSFAFTSPALAEGNSAAGAPIFAANCAACHAGGRNLVNPAKTLSKTDLTKYHKDSPEEIVKQMTNGAGAMPAFRGRLKPDQMENIAAYVLEQAEKGW